MQQYLVEAVAAYQAGDFERALQLLSHMPDTAMPLQALALKANIFARRGESRAAGETFLRAARMPGADKALLLRLAGRMLDQAGETTRLAEAGVEILQSVTEDPALASAIVSALQGAGRGAEAADFVSRLDPADPAQVMLGVTVLRSANSIDRMLPLLDAALQHFPSDGMLNAERFNAALDLCDFDIQADCLRRIMDEGDDAGQNMFAAQSMHRRLMWSDDEAANMRPGLDHFLLSRQINGYTPARRRFGAAHEKIRVGYLSGDFYGHATMILLREVLMAHDRTRFEIGLFCHTAADHSAEQEAWPDVLRQAIIPLRDLDDAAAARAISEWRADILVDLKGFTGGHRLGIVSLSDAPVKATWLGFPGSVPGVGLDYAITDPIVTPDSSRPFYEERLCRLPETYQANDSAARARPGSARRADHGLPEGAVVFASFNNVMKINREMVGLWAQILARTPGSIFWCLAPVSARANLLAAFARDGIGPDRLVFAEAIAYEKHVDRMALADLALDTFPCNGHTTTSDALWAGVPVVALSGNSFTSRVAESLLHAIGLPQLAVHDRAAYADLAVALHDDPERRADLRTKLAQNTRIQPLFDSERFTLHLERAYEMMAERARAGLAPDHIDVEALPARQAPFL
ncbi:Glycosyl transferase family 41 [Ensifer adhaerens]|nr:Glycosyl transferase family 41 [Ensifer adhaerens]